MILQAYPPRQAQEGACRFHSAVPAESSQAATRRFRLGARTQARWLQAANPRPRRRVRLYTMNGTNWSDRYPRIADDAARIKGDANIDAEVVCLDSKGIPQFELLHKQGKRRRSLGARFRSFRPRRRRSTQASVAGTQKRSCQTADPLAGRDSIRRTCRRPRRAHVRGDVRAWIGGHRSGEPRFIAPAHRKAGSR